MARSWHDAAGEGSRAVTASRATVPVWVVRVNAVRGGQLFAGKPAKAARQHGGSDRFAVTLCLVAEPPKVARQYIEPAANETSKTLA
jgi:hypothetical protein